MTFKLSQRSLDRMNGVDDRLVNVVKRAIELTEIDFGVTEGLRSPQRQKELVEQGLSQTLKSKHLTGHAVDLVAFVDGKVTWDKKPYYKIADAMKQSAKELNVNIRWGGEFKSFFDAPHFELV